MENWQIEVIKATFKRCYGLRDLIHNIALGNEAIKTLSYQTGFRVDFLTKHIEQIKEI